MVEDPKKLVDVVVPPPQTSSNKKAPKKVWKPIAPKKKKEDDPPLVLAENTVNIDIDIVVKKHNKKEPKPDNIEKVRKKVKALTKHYIFGHALIFHIPIMKIHGAPTYHDVLS